MYSTDEINSSRIDRMDSRARPNERTDLFPYSCGGRLSSDSVQYLVSKYVVVVQEKCTTQTRNAARTSTQRRDRAVASRRRPGGHCTLARTRVPRTTQVYLDADLALKEQALQKARPSRALDGLLTFLKNLYSCRLCRAPSRNGRDHKFTRRKHSA